MIWDFRIQLTKSDLFVDSFKIFSFSLLFCFVFGLIGIGCGAVGYVGEGGKRIYFFGKQMHGSSSKVGATSLTLSGRMS